MNQFEYDIAEWIVNNREEIKDFLNASCEQFNSNRILYKEAPWVFEEFLQDYKRSKLIHYVAEHFPNQFDNIYLLITPDFVNIILTE